jgi:hypothetical protein
MNERRLIEPMLFPLQAHRAPGRRYDSSVIPNDQGSQSAAEPRQVLGPDLNCSESTVQGSSPMESALGQNAKSSH